MKENILNIYQDLFRAVLFSSLKDERYLVGASIRQILYNAMKCVLGKPSIKKTTTKTKSKVNGYPTQN